MALNIILKPQLERLVDKIKDSKQDKLTAGNGILINNNIISTDGVDSSSALITPTEFDSLE